MRVILSLVALCINCRDWYLISSFAHKCIWPTYIIKKSSSQFSKYRTSGWRHLEVPYARYSSTTLSPHKSCWAANPSFPFFTEKISSRATRNEHTKLLFPLVWTLWFLHRVCPCLYVFACYYRWFAFSGMHFPSST